MNNENLNDCNDCLFSSDFEKVAPISCVRKDSPWADMMTKVFQRAEELYQEEKLSDAA